MGCIAIRRASPGHQPIKCHDLAVCGLLISTSGTVEHRKMIDQLVEVDHGEHLLFFTLPMIADFVTNMAPFIPFQVILVIV